MSTALTGCFLAVEAGGAARRGRRALAAFGVAAEDAAGEAPRARARSTHALYDALYALDPARSTTRAHR